MACNSLWTDEEKTLIDRYIMEEITHDALMAALPHRSAKGIGKQIVRRSRLANKPKRTYFRQNISFGLDPDDPGLIDDWSRQHERLSKVGSAKLLERIMKKHPQMCGMC